MFSVSVALFIAIVCLWILWRKQRFSVLRNLGIPGPEPNFLFGNMLELSAKTPLRCHQEWLKKYGDVVGYYFGVYPVVLVADIELVKKIQISEAQKFINRPEFFSSTRRRPEFGLPLSHGLAELKDKRWKEIRSTLTPSFTTSKLKSMSPVLNKTLDTFLENIDKKAQSGESFDIYKMYQALTMDVIGRTGFGIQTMCQKNEDDPFLKACRVFFTSGNIDSHLLFLTFSFPELDIIIKAVQKLKSLFVREDIRIVKFINRRVKDVIQMRRSNTSIRRQDVLQLMMDAEIKSGDTALKLKDLAAGSNESSESTKPETAEKSGNIFRYMNNAEVLDNALLFYLAGYETTNLALGFCTHLLVHHPEVQERVRSEVQSLKEQEGKLDYAEVQQLQYLDQVLNESLRMYPPIYTFNMREVKEDIQLGEFHLKRGITVQVPTHTLQHDEKFWQEPETFNPERFSPENKSQMTALAFQAFGAGPRNCVGMRLAQMEAKLTLARLLLKYRLVKCEKTDKKNPSLVITTAALKPAKGVFVKAEPL